MEQYNDKLQPVLNPNPELELKNDGAFQFFSKLPPALREIIWIFVLPCPRVLEFRYGLTQLACSSAARASQRNIYRLLSVCQEARSAVAKYYQPIKIAFLGSRFMYQTLSVIYVDFERDLFYFPRSCLDIVLRGIINQIHPQMNKVKNLAFPANKFHRLTREEYCIPPCLEALGNIQEITFIQCDKDEAVNESRLAPLVRINVRDDDTHSEFDLVRSIFASPTIASVYQSHNVKITFAILYRPSLAETLTQSKLDESDVS